MSTFYGESLQGERAVEPTRARLGDRPSASAMEKPRITLHLGSGAQQAHAANMYQLGNAGQAPITVRSHAILPLVQPGHLS